MKLRVFFRWGGGALLAGMLLTSPVMAKAKGKSQENIPVQETVVIQEGQVAGKTPPGHGKGQKKGWVKHGTVMPPGQQKNLVEKGKYPKGLQKTK